MLPLVLGGIAAAAVGYALKEYCEEEGCFWDEEYDTVVSKPKSIANIVHNKKVYLYQVGLLEASRLLGSIDKKFEYKKFEKLKKYNNEIEDTLSKEVKQYLEIYKTYLDDAEELILNYVSGLQVLNNKDIPYDKYSDVEKRFVKKAHKFIGKLHHYLNIELYTKKGELCIESVNAMIKGSAMLKKHL